MRCQILLYLYNRMADFEVTLTAYYLKMGIDCQIIPIAEKLQDVTAESGIVYLPQKTVENILQNGTENIAGLIISGGFDLMESPKLNQLIQNLHRDHKLLAAICAGPTFLAYAGVLFEFQFTTTKTPDFFIQEHQKDPFPWGNYLDKRVVRDRHIITAKGDAFVDFALEIWDWFHIFKNPAEKDETRRDFTPLPYI